MHYIISNIEVLCLGALYCLKMSHIVSLSQSSDSPVPFTCINCHHSISLCK